MLQEGQEGDALEGEGEEVLSEGEEGLAGAYPVSWTYLERTWVRL